MSTTNPQIRDTEWDALQRKFGNLPKLPQTTTEEQLTRRAVEIAEKIDTLENKTVDQLDELEDDVDETILEQYRCKRIAEIRRRKQLERFGEVYHVGKNDFVVEVTRASEVDPVHRAVTRCADEEESASEGEEKKGLQKSKRKGTWVVVHMYKDSVPASEALNNVLPEVARRHRDVKFVMARADDVVDSYPEDKIPTVLLYRSGICQAQLIRRQKEWGGERATAAAFEKVLAGHGVLEGTGGMEEGDGYITDDEEEDVVRRGARHIQISYRGNRGEKPRKASDKSDEDVGVARSRGYSSTALDAKVERGY